MSSAAKLSEARVLSCQLPPAWSASFLVLVKGVAELAMEQSKRGGGKTDVREAFTKLLKCNVEVSSLRLALLVQHLSLRLAALALSLSLPARCVGDSPFLVTALLQEKHGGVWQCFVGKKFAFNVRSHTASNYSQQMIICEVPIGGSSQHLLAYRSPPAELAGSPAEPEPEPEAASLPAAAGIVQVVDTDMPTKQRDQMLQMLTDVITEMRGGAKPEDAKVDDSKLGQILRERIMKDLKWSPTWHVITGAEKLSGWDSAVTAEKGTRFSAISRPIKVEIFKHNDSSVLPPVGHMSNWFSCNAALMQAMAYLMFMGFAAVSSPANTTRLSRLLR